MNTNQRKLIAALSLCAAVVPGLVSAVAVSGQGTWETTLQGRDLDGNRATFEAYYDIALDITWLTDANHARSGTLDWNNANAWASHLNPYDSGITGWRLPSVNADDSGCIWSNYGADCGYNVTTQNSEMAHMFYVTLGNKAITSISGSAPQEGWGLTNTGPFANLQPNDYWSSTEYVPYTGRAWAFDFGYGDQYRYIKTTGLFAWAVRDGDIYVASTVPVPAPAWLFVSGLLGLVGITKRKKAA